MAMRRLFETAVKLPGAPGLRRLTVTEEQWLEAARDLAAAGARLLALWASGQSHGSQSVYAAFAPEPPDPPAGWVGRALAWSPTGARMLGRGHADSDPVAAGRVG